MKKGGRSSGAWVTIGVLVATVGACTSETPPTNQADCERSERCQATGQCTWDFAVQRCVIGSNAECARARICQKERRCTKVGDGCAATE
jgi:hypothetical protein